MGIAGAGEAAGAGRGGAGGRGAGTGGTGMDSSRRLSSQAPPRSTMSPKGLSGSTALRGTRGSRAVTRVLESMGLFR